MTIIQNLLSFLVFLAIAFFLSEDKKNINWKLILLGLFWQFVIALLILKIPAIIAVFSYVNDALQALTKATTKATTFVFGGLADPNKTTDLGFILVLQGFPVLIVLSALSALLTYLRILPFVIRIFSFFFRKTLRVGGTLGIAVSANIFMGMSETPLIISSYLKTLTRSELFSLMVCGTSCIASSVMALLSIIISPVIPNAITHIISAVLISIPCALTIARIIVPETNAHLTEGLDAEFSEGSSVIESIFHGIIAGSKVLITIVAMLIGFIALIDLLNQLLALLPMISNEPISLQRMLGTIMSPLTWLIGIPIEEMQIAGSLLGSKIAFNEVIAFQEFLNVSDQLSEKSRVLMIYALCGFANFSSIGIMVGVYNALVPQRKSEVAKFGIKSIVAGTITNCLTASVVSLLFYI